MGGDEEGSVELATHTELEVHADAEPALLAAGHLVLQSYLAEPESVIGLQRREADGISFSAGASHVYVEETDPVRDLVRQAAQHLGALLPCGPLATAALSSDVRHSPPCFLESVHLARPAEARDAVRCLQGQPPRPLRVVLTRSLEGIGVQTVMWRETGRRLQRSEFQRRLCTAVRAVLTASDTPMAELRGLLISTEEHPAHDPELEARIAAVWARVLSVPRQQITPEVSYFELGGNSLNAFKLANLLRREFQCDLSIRDIIEHPTVREIGLLLRQSPQGSDP